MKEYERNVKKGINPSIPCNYYPDDNPDKEPTAYQNHRQAQILLITKIQAPSCFRLGAWFVNVIS
jgi:homoserine O-succinyltransferase